VSSNPGTRKAYRAQLNVNHDGLVNEFGGTIAEFERDKKRARTTGLIILGVAIALFACVVLGALGSSY
jgi:hypothetical protein